MDKRLAPSSLRWESLGQEIKGHAHLKDEQCSGRPSAPIAQHSRFLTAPCCKRLQPSLSPRPNTLRSWSVNSPAHHHWGGTTLGAHSMRCPRAPSGLSTGCPRRHLLVGAPSRAPSLTSPSHPTPTPLLPPTPLPKQHWSPPLRVRFWSGYPRHDKARLRPLGKRWEDPGGGVALSSGGFVHGCPVCFIDGYTHTLEGGKGHPNLGPEPGFPPSRPLPRRGS